MPEREYTAEQLLKAMDQCRISVEPQGIDRWTINCDMSQVDRHALWRAVDANPDGWPTARAALTAAVRALEGRDTE